MAECEHMKAGRLRRFTPGEEALADEIFGASLDLGRARLMALPFWRRAFVAGPRLMLWPARSALFDFARPDVPLTLQAVFVHELTHVWQAQRGTNLLFAKLKAGDGARAYAYELAVGCDFAGLNIEQQAMLVQHAFLAARGGAAPYPAELYLAAAPAWRGRA